jgi:hypothetical protein
MYRAYHGLELAVYSETTSEYAYVNAKVRSMAKEDFHADFFDGDFADRARKNTIREERINEWLVQHCINFLAIFLGRKIFHSVS